LSAVIYRKSFAPGAEARISRCSIGTAEAVPFPFIVGRFVVGRLSKIAAAKAGQSFGDFCGMPEGIP
jgi:hypothetical protein